MKSCKSYKRESTSASDEGSEREEAKAGESDSMDKFCGMQNIEGLGGLAWLYTDRPGGILG
jgi:hypothetical protein